MPELMPLSGGWLMAKLRCQQPLQNLEVAVLCFGPTQGVSFSLFVGHVSNCRIRVPSFHFQSDSPVCSKADCFPNGAMSLRPRSEIGRFTIGNFPVATIVATKRHFRLPASNARRTFTLVNTGGQSRDRSDDLTLFRRALYRLSYLTRITSERPTLAGGTTTLRT
jgi:hypothetical protein